MRKKGRTGVGGKGEAAESMPTDFPVTRKSETLPRVEERGSDGSQQTRTRHSGSH